MTTIFKGSTNGGANRFFVKDEKIMVAGQGVGGRQEVTLRAEEGDKGGSLENIWGFSVIKGDGTLDPDFEASNIRVFETEAGNVRVQLGPENVGGGLVFEFEDKFYKDVNNKKIEAKLADSGISTDGEVNSKAEGAAINFALFLEQMLEADALDFIADAGADTSKITNIDAQLDPVQLNSDKDILADNSVKFGGAGVSGSTKTDPFSSEGAAENFIDTLFLADSQNGFLDDILV